MSRLDDTPIHHDKVQRTQNSSCLFVRWRVNLITRHLVTTRIQSKEKRGHPLISQNQMISNDKTLFFNWCNTRPKVCNICGFFVVVVILKILAMGDPEIMSREPIRLHCQTTRMRMTNIFKKREELMVLFLFLRNRLIQTLVTRNPYTHFSFGLVHVTIRPIARYWQHPQLLRETVKSTSTRHEFWSAVNNLARVRFVFVVANNWMFPSSRQNITLSIKIEYFIHLHPV